MKYPLILLLLFLGIILRFYHLPDYSYFGTDQVTELRIAEDILNGDLRLIGTKTSIAEVRNGAIIYYFLAPFLAIFRGDPLAGTFFQAGLILASAVLLYLFLWNRNRKFQAFLVAFFIVASPLLVGYSRQTFLAFYPLFWTTLFLVILTRLWEKPSSVLAIILGLVVGLTLQIHYDGLALLLPSLLVLKLRQTTKFLLGLFIGLFPLIAFEVKSNFFNFQAFLSFLSRPHLQSNFSQISYWSETTSQILLGRDLPLIALFAFTLMGAFLLKIFSRLQKLEVISLLQIIGALLFSIFFVRENVPNYLIPAFTPFFILLAASLLWFLNIFPRPLRLGLVAGLTISLVVGNLAAYFKKPPLAIGGIRRAVRLINSDLPPRKSFNVSLVHAGESQGIPLRFFLDSRLLLPPTDYKNADLLYVVTEPGIILTPTTSWEISTFGEFNIIRSWPLPNGFQLLKLAKKV